MHDLKPAGQVSSNISTILAVPSCGRKSTELCFGNGWDAFVTPTSGGSATFVVRPVLDDTWKSTEIFDVVRIRIALEYWHEKTVLQQLQEMRLLK